MKSFVTIVIWAFINAFLTGCGAKLPSKYVLATLNGYHTHAELGPDPMPTLETRVSTDGGRTWAAPKTPKTCVLPVQPHSCSLTEIRTWIEPGLASNNEKYVLVFFHNNYDEDLHAFTTRLKRVVSTDGELWTNSRISVQVPWQFDELGFYAKPAVAYDYQARRWVVAYRTAGGHVRVERLADQATDADLPSNDPLPRVNVDAGTHIAMASHDGKFYIVYREVGFVSFVSIESRSSSSEGDGASVRDLAIARDGSFIPSERSPALFSGIGGELILVVRNPDPSDPSQYSLISTYRLGEFRTWDPVAQIRTRKLNPDSSPTAAGVFSEFLVADGLAEPASEDEHTFNTLVFFKRDQGFGSIAPVAVPTLVRNGAATLVFGN